MQGPLIQHLELTVKVVMYEHIANTQKVENDLLLVSCSKTSKLIGR